MFIKVKISLDSGRIHFPTPLFIFVTVFFFSKIYATFVKRHVRIMNARLEQFLAAENISQAQFAETLGVARASISHILAGRNKPGYDFISSLMLHYPRLNMDWLFFGKGKMYKEPATAVQSPAIVVEPEENTLFSDVVETPDSAPQNEESAPVPAKETEIPDSPKDNVQAASSGRKISRIVVFYDDNTFAELS